MSQPAGRPPEGPAPASAVVIGTGLIGTSVALALRSRGVAVWLADADPAAARLAADIGAGEVLPATVLERPPAGPADIAVLAVPPAAVAATLAAAQARGLARWYTDVASVKSQPLAQAAGLGCDLGSFVPGHPLAGRERSGPAAARADLFLGRPWVVCHGAGITAAGRGRGRRRWPGPVARSRCWPARPSTTPGSRWSRTPRTWCRPRWPPG